MGKVLIENSADRAVSHGKISILTAIVRSSSGILQEGGVGHFTDGNDSIFPGRSTGVPESGSR